MKENEPYLSRYHYRYSEEEEEEHSSLILPLLREIVRGVVGLEVYPLSGRQVQPVEVCAVDVARRSPKHIQETVYDDHRLQM